MERGAAFDCQTLEIKVYNKSMTYSEISGPDFNPYFDNPTQGSFENDFAGEPHEEVLSDGSVGFHPERISGGLGADEAVVLLGGLQRVRYRSKDWMARATEMRGEIVQ